MWASPPASISIIEIATILSRKPLDTRNTRPVAVVNETFVKEFLDGKDPLGVRFNRGDRALFSIVGVVNDVHRSALDADPPPMIYLSMFQVESGASARTAFIMRLARPAEKATPRIFSAVQQEIWAVDADLPTYNTTTLAALVSESVAQSTIYDPTYKWLRTSCTDLGFDWYLRCYIVPSFRAHTRTGAEDGSRC